MKKVIQILAVVGTGLVIGSVAGKILKTEGKQMRNTLKDLVEKGKFHTKSAIKSKQDEFEFYFI